MNYSFISYGHTSLKKIHPRTPVLCVGLGSTAVAAERHWGKLGKGRQGNFLEQRPSLELLLPAQNNVVSRAVVPLEEFLGEQSCG